MALHVHVVHVGVLLLTKALVIYLPLTKKDSWRKKQFILFFFITIRTTHWNRGVEKQLRLKERDLSIIFSSYTNQHSSSLQYMHIFKGGDYQGLLIITVHLSQQWFFHYAIYPIHGIKEKFSQSPSLNLAGSTYVSKVLHNMQIVHINFPALSKPTELYEQILS